MHLTYEIEYQVIDYNNKVIGIYITRDDNVGYLPTYPSAIYDEYDIPIKFMDDVEWRDLNTTRTFLENIYRESNNRIACMPRVKIMEDRLIVGLLTNGNQFVKLVEPEIDSNEDSDDKGSEDGLITLQERDYLSVDEKIQTRNDDLSNDKIDTIRNIELEESFYKMFRNIVRRNLGLREWASQKSELMKILEDKTGLYLQKLEAIDKILREVTQTSVIFTQMSSRVLANIREIVNCNERENDCTNLDYCMISGDKSGVKGCIQIIPIKNLINGLDNQELYYAKIADELIRFKKMKQFIIESDKYLSLSKIEYNITETEILIIQSLLNLKFFEGMTPARENSYINYRVYDRVNPEKTKFYSHDVALRDLDRDNGPDTQDNIDSQDIVQEIVEITDSGCALTKKQLIGYLQEQFPPKTYEIYYKTALSLCSYEIILNILRDFDDRFKRWSIIDLKRDLVEIYRYYKEDMQSLIILAIELNKKVILERVLDKAITMDNMLLSDDFYITYVDMILIAKYYNLPIILISSMGIIQKLLPDTVIIPNKVKTDKWYFIKVPSIVTRVKKSDFPIYKLLTYAGSLKISLDIVSTSLRENIEKTLAEPRDILSFLLENVKPKKKYRLKLIEGVKPVKQRIRIVE